MKKIILLFFALLSLLINAQKSKSTKIGLARLDELKISVYKKDSSARAIILFDHTNVYIDQKNNFDFRTDYYKHVKFLDKDDTNEVTVSIFLYKKQKVIKIKAVTHNLFGEKINSIYLTEDKIFQKQVSANYKGVTFTLPNIKNGTIIEYSYSLLSPYSYLNDWYFQEEIPKIKSDYTYSVPRNWKYKTRIVGLKKLDGKVKKRCSYVSGIGEGDCTSLSFGMDHVPAFKEEDYMLSKENFLSKLIFDLTKYTDTRGNLTKYTKPRKDAEKT